mmetsp:Transcript_86794/g.273932  ORF Transcript_86794/g.273932 Transcript_86794/m.273932 type:complete len:294 (+) Transcript_86794:103-984(+)
MRSHPISSGDRSLINQPQGYGGVQPLRKVQGARLLDVLILVLLPWLMFSLIACLFTFAFEEFAPLVWALLVASSLLALLFVSLGGSAGRTWHLVALGVFVLVSLGAAVAVGLCTEHSYMKEYWRLDNGALYKHVNPDDPGASHTDATMLEFRQGTFVDVQRSVGYVRAGTVYCVAPVTSRLDETSAQYWAVGIDCCRWRGGFTCDDAEDPEGLSGVPQVDSDGVFQAAVRMAESVYEFSPLQATPVFVKWRSDPVTYKDGLWTSAAIVVVVSSAVHLFLFSLCGFLAAKCLPR